MLILTLYLPVRRFGLDATKEGIKKKGGEHES